MEHPFKYSFLSGLQHSLFSLHTTCLREGGHHHLAAVVLHGLIYSKVTFAIIHDTIISLVDNNDHKAILPYIQLYSPVVTGK